MEIPYPRLCLDVIYFHRLGLSLELSLVLLFFYTVLTEEGNVNLSESCWIGVAFKPQ